MKKLVKIPFDIEKAKNGAKIVTRNDLSVRIICFDRVDHKESSCIEHYPIIGLVLENGNERIYSFSTDGKFRSDGDHGTDLFILEEIEEEEPKFEPFQKVLIRDSDAQFWRPSIFSYYNTDSEYRFCVVGGDSYKYCIPYNDNEHLSCTKDNPK